MDPYLEHEWRGVHATLVTFSGAALNETLPEDLAARSDDREYFETVTMPTRSMASKVPSESAIAVDEPLILVLETEPTTEHFIEIIEPDGGRVVTVIKFVSPSNKTPGPGHDAYLAKRKEVLSNDTHLVQIDLVRGGNWRELILPYTVPPKHRTAYRVFIKRSDEWTAQLYAIKLRQRLPRIRIRLRPNDPEVVLDLQTLLDRTYDSGRYGSIDYSKPCDPPLDEEDAKWLAGLIASRPA